MRKTAGHRCAALLGAMSVLLFAAGPINGGNTMPSAALNASQDPLARVLLHGTITDVDGKALTDVQLIVHWDPSGAKSGLTTNVGMSQDRFLKTDTHGNFYAEIPPGFYDVLATAPGLDPVCAKLRLKPAGNVTYNTKLLTDPAVASELAAAAK